MYKGLVCRVRETALLLIPEVVLLGRKYQIGLPSHTTQNENGSKYINNHHRKKVYRYIYNLS